MSFTFFTIPIGPVDRKRCRFNTNRKHDTGSAISSTILGGH